MDDQEWLAEMLSEQKSAKVKINSSMRSKRAKWVQMAQKNAEQMLKVRLRSKLGYIERFESLADALQLGEVPGRIECFDISHSSGDQTVASCVVFNQEGALKQDYRRFNIKGITQGDDYAALKQAVERRFTRVIKEDGIIPDLVLIDGGKGQLNSVSEIVDTLPLENMLLVGVAKGVDRRAGQERLFLSNAAGPIILPEESAALHLIQEIRDEAHRFAITGHRQRQRKKQTSSVLDTVAGMGPKRRQSLIKQFGGLRQIERASVDDIASVRGISSELAQRIYNALHPDAD
jgi:excinuclease ABC subunit C